MARLSSSCPYTFWRLCQNQTILRMMLRSILILHLKSLTKDIKCVFICVCVALELFCYWMFCYIFVFSFRNKQKTKSYNCLCQSERSTETNYLLHNPHQSKVFSFWKNKQYQGVIQIKVFNTEFNKSLFINHKELLWKKVCNFISSINIKIQKRWLNLISITPLAFV